MMRCNVFAHLLFAAVLTAGVAAAQSTTGPASSGTGTGTGSGTPGTPTGAGGHPGDLDLPVAKPVYQGAPPPENEPPLPPPEIDPPTETPPTFFGEEIDSESDSIVYVIDISGSMRGSRLRRAKAELVRSISALSDNFRFNIIAYTCSHRQWKRSLQDATDANKSDATAWAEGLNANGATGTGPATAAGLSSDRDNMSVVLLTDGSPNCGARGPSGHRRMISSANRQGATINVFGISASGSYRSFCQGVAQDSGGSYTDVP